MKEGFDDRYEYTGGQGCGYGKKVYASGTIHEACSRMVRRTAKVSALFPMATCTRATARMACKTVKASVSGLMVMFMRVNGKTDDNMEKV